MVIGDGIDRGGPRRRQQVARRQARSVRRARFVGGLADRPRAEDQHVGRSRPSERMEALEVAAVGGGVVAGRRPTHDGEVRLVHELGRGDAAADRAGVIDQPRCLLRRPDAGGVARSGPGGERGDDLRVHRPREIDDALPLRARQHALEAGRRRRGRRVGRGKVCRVRPRSADADIGRPERGGELAQARIVQVDRRPILVQVGIHAGGRVRALRPGGRRGLLETASGSVP